MRFSARLRRAETKMLFVYQQGSQACWQKGTRNASLCFRNRDKLFLNKYTYTIYIHCIFLSCYSKPVRYIHGNVVLGKTWIQDQDPYMHITYVGLLTNRNECSCCAPKARENFWYRAPSDLMRAPLAEIRAPLSTWPPPNGKSGSALVWDPHGLPTWDPHGTHLGVLAGSPL